MANQSILRAAQILSLFSLARPQLSTSEIAREMGLPVSTVHGLVRSLVQTGYMTQASDSREYRLGLRLTELGALHMASLEINQKASYPAFYLAQETGFFASVGVYDKGSVVITFSTNPLRTGPDRPHLGNRLPAYCTSIGRSVLAFLSPDERRDYFEGVKLIKYTPKTKTDRKLILEEIESAHKRGYAVARQEYRLDLAHIAAPIFRAKGEVVGGISLSSDPLSMSETGEEELAQKVMNAAAHISSLMGHQPNPLFRSEDD